MMRLRLVTLLALLVSVPALAGRFDPYSAEYSLYRGGSTLGTGTVSLKAADKPDCFIYSYLAKPSWLFRWATGSITERSEFCLIDGLMVPERYRFHRSGIGAEDDNFSLDFDPERRVITDHKGMERDWPIGALDRLQVQLEALRLVEGIELPPAPRSLTVEVVDDDRIKEYTLAVTGSETIKVPAGSFETVRVERINDPKKTTRFWVAPALGDLLVKVEQQRKDDPPIGIELSRVPGGQGR